jgi:hypothetical protein
MVEMEQQEHEESQESQEHLAVMALGAGVAGHRVVISLLKFLVLSCRALSSLDELFLL